ISPANTPANLAASGFPTTDSSTVCTDDNADVEHTASVHPESDASCASRRTPGRPAIAPEATSCLKISLLCLCQAPTVASHASSDAGTAYAARKSASRARLAIRSLPPPILSLIAYCSRSHCQLTPCSRHIWLKATR